jgi:hypothetical protein
MESISTILGGVYVLHVLQVFNGCAPDVGTNCQLCLSVIKDQILNRASMTCKVSGLFFFVTVSLAGAR